MQKPRVLDTLAYTLKDAAWVSGVGIRKLRECIRKNQLSSIRVGQRRLVFRHELLTFLRLRQQNHYVPFHAGPKRAQAQAGPRTTGL